MKNHFTVEPIVGLRLSVEEEAILMTEITDDAVKSEQDSIDFSRVQAIEEGVESTQNLRTNESAKIDVNLVGIVADMAVAGTDADPADLFCGEYLSVEGIADKAREVMDKITSLLATGWAKLSKAFRYWFVMIEHWLARIEELEKNLAAASGKKLRDDKPLTLKPGNSWMHSFMVDSKLVSQNEFTKQFADMTKLIGVSFQTMPELAMKMADKVCHAADTFKCDGNEKVQVTNLLNALGNLWIDYFDCVSAYSQLNHDSSTHFLTSKKTMGDFYVQVKVPAILNVAWREENEVSANDNMLLNAISNIRVSSRDLEGQMHYGQPNKFVIAPLSLPDIGNGIKGIKAMVNQYQSFKEGPVSTGLEKIGKKISDSVTRHVYNEIKTRGSNASHDAMELFKTLTNFNVAYLNWSKEPMTGIFSRLMVIIYSHLDLLEKSLDKYV